MRDESASAAVEPRYKASRDTLNITHTARKRSQSGVSAGRRRGRGRERGDCVSCCVMRSCYVLLLGALVLVCNAQVLWRSTGECEFLLAFLHTV